MLGRAEARGAEEEEALGQGAGCGAGPGRGSSWVPPCSGQLLRRGTGGVRGRAWRLRLLPPQRGAKGWVAVGRWGATRAIRWTDEVNARQESSASLPSTTRERAARGWHGCPQRMSFYSPSDGTHVRRTASAGRAARSRRGAGRGDRSAGGRRWLVLAPPPVRRSWHATCPVAVRSGPGAERPASCPDCFAWGILRRYGKPSKAELVAPPGAGSEPAAVALDELEALIGISEEAAHGSDD